MTPPTTLEGIYKYLSSGMIRAIGETYAKRLVKEFGEEVFDVIEQHPERLREVGGIGPKRAERIVAGWAEQKAVREIMLFLHAHGVGTSRAVRIYKTYGSDAVATISENSSLAAALGNKACRDNRSVLYQRVPRMFADLTMARGDGRYARMIKALSRVDLLILDDVDGLSSTAS